MKQELINYIIAIIINYLLLVTDAMDWQQMVQYSEKEINFIHSLLAALLPNQTICDTLETLEAEPYILQRWYKLFDCLLFQSKIHSLFMITEF